MWQTKYASAIPKNFELGFDFRPRSEGDFLTGCPLSVEGVDPTLESQFNCLNWKQESCMHTNNTLWYCKMFIQG